MLMYATSTSIISLIKMISNNNTAPKEQDTQDLPLFKVIESHNNPYNGKLRLFTLQQQQGAGRTIAFGTGGKEDGNPVVVFPPAGAGNRRMILSLHSIAVPHNLKLICVNRPGMGDTSSAPQPGSRAHMAAARDDIVAVLDALDIERVGLLFMCAGTPFALSFAARNPERTTGQMMGVASWVLPADCEVNKPIYRFGANHTPLWLTSRVVGTVMRGILCSISSAPRGWSSMKRRLSAEEYAVLCERFGNEEEFRRQIEWIFEEDRHGTSADISVLLSAGRDLDIDYGSTSGGDACFFHGENDEVTPVEAAEWIAEQLLPSATLNVLPQGTHEGTLFFLHPELIESLKFLGG